MLSYATTIVSLDTPWRDITFAKSSGGITFTPQPDRALDMEALIGSEFIAVDDADVRVVNMFCEPISFCQEVRVRISAHINSEQ
jgi:hypothetical protein